MYYNADTMQGICDADSKVYSEPCTHIQKYYCMNKNAL